VIDDGQVRERGRHDELLANGGLYADLYRTQFSRQLVGAGVPSGPPNGHLAPHPPHGDHGLRTPIGPWRGPSGPRQSNGA